LAARHAIRIEWASRPCAARCWHQQPRPSTRLDGFPVGVSSILRKAEYEVAVRIDFDAALRLKNVGHRAESIYSLTDPVIPET
jgi:hypothetical protein